MTKRDGAEFDAIIVGAGFAGLYMLHRLRGLGLRVLALEAGDGVGGTWYWNRYPGARCDGESMFYSYQFDDALQQEWSWTERYARQPEILAYANHVADRYNLRPHIRFETRVAAAGFDEAAALWTVTTATGDRLTAQYVVLANGCLSSPNKPLIDGMADFRGAVYHTGEWPHEGVDFTGLRVGIVGTGSSAIQAIPMIAQQAAQLTVFQRTANYVVPAQNRPLDAAEVSAMKADYATLRAKARATATGNPFEINPQSALAVSAAQRNREYEKRWQAGGLIFITSFNDLLLDPQANATAAEFVRDKIRAIVADAGTAELLCPDNTLGCKRLCVDTGYYETYNRPNVQLVDIRETPVERLTPEGLSVGGTVYPFDAIVFATGFDAMTGAILKIDITGRDGVKLRDEWADGPRAYLGLGIAGFPNLFTITGPQSPSVLTNMIPTIEQHVEWIADCIGWLRDRGVATIEAEREAQESWVAHSNEAADITLRVDCNSWYVGANVPGKPRVFMPYIAGMPAYRRKCEAVARSGYEGFTLNGTPGAA
jgi:cation diffusion facilitator CzcD-associated flavoprotein CzcO